MATFYDGYRRRFYASRVRETVYGNCGSNLVYIFNLEGGDALRPKKAIVSDRELCNGLEASRDEYHLERSLDATINLWASPLSMAWSWGYALGTDTPAEVAGGGLLDYKHTITMVAAGTPQYSASVEEHMGGQTSAAVTDYCHGGVCVDGIDLNWGRTGFVKHSINLIGGGQTAAATTKNESSGFSTPQVYFTANKALMYIKACGTEHTPEWTTAGGWTPPTAPGASSQSYSGFTSIGSYIETAALSWKTNLERRNAAGSSTTTGIFGVQPYRNSPSATLNVTWESNTDTDDYIWAQLDSTEANLAEYTILIEFLSDTQTVASGVYYSAFIALPCCGILTPPTTGGGPREIRKDSISFYAKNGISGATDQIYVFVADMIAGANAGTS